MSQINTFAERFRLGRPSATPFAHVGELKYCVTCRQDVDADMQAHHQGVTYSWKMWCRRCGGVIERGIYHNVPLVSEVPLPAAVVEWSLAPGGPDRR